MAKVKEIYVEASFTRNIGNYENVRPTAGITMTIEPGDDVLDVFKKSWDVVGDQISSQLALFDENKKSGARKGL